ncbi:MAG: nucleotide-binding universal stress UspA family protein [Sphingobacteriales bacterium]|jgi:nucleotide-binding universal stress UspA family protein
MSPIGVLIDFTDLCFTSVRFAAEISKKNKAKISLIHVAHDEKKKAEVEAKFEPYIKMLKDAGLETKIELTFGDFEDVIPKFLKQLGVELVIVGTHGAKGIKQALFGSNILHLMQHISQPAIVVHKNSITPKQGDSKILFTMAPHENFQKKISETIKMARIFDSKIIVYTILKSGDVLGEDIKRNKKLALEAFKNEGVNYEVVDEPATVYSFGFGKQILQYSSDNNIDVVSILSTVSTQAVLGNADKERIILNEKEIPVFCVNN